jgi:hypothetical protein
MKEGKYMHWQENIKCVKQSDMVWKLEEVSTLQKKRQVSVTISDNVTEIAEVGAHCSNIWFLTFVERLKDATNNDGGSVI